MDQFFQKTVGSNFACGFKWAWSTIRLQTRTTNSCHRTDQDIITPETFDSFHNTPIKLQTRKAMLNGQWPGHGCEYCKHIEDSGGVSDRMYANEHIHNAYIPHELITNPKSLKTTPTMVEVYFSNLCNMSCIYCNESFSTVWEQEKLKHNEPIAPNLLSISSVDYKKMTDAFFTWLDKNIYSIFELNILGGEPFFQPELDRMLAFIETHPNPDLTLKIFSNLKVPTQKFSTILRKLDSFIECNIVKQVEIITSIDCWGPEQEYIRTGISLRQWEENFSYMVKNHQNINIRTHGTITCLTIKTIYGLIEKINFYNSFRSNSEIIYSSDLLVEPEFLQSGIFPSGFFDDDFAAILQIVQEDYTKEKITNHWLSVNNHQYKPELILKLKAFLTTLDIRRNTNWKSTFKWLDEFQV